MEDTVPPSSARELHRHATNDDLVSPMHNPSVSFSEALRSPGVASSYCDLSLDDDTLSEIDTRRMSAWDKRDMRRLGKTQQMRRSYRTLSMLSFTVVVQATWEFVLV